MENITLRLEREAPRQNDAVSSPSPEMFSFPVTPTAEDVESEFEFGSCVTVTPGSPDLDPTRPTTASPADQFFLNGRLLPHAFPNLTQSGPRPSFSGRENMNNVLSRGTSIGSSISSKDYSLLSSRSNSTNSRGGGGGGGGGSTCSSCSSARTSSSEVSERGAFQKRMKSQGNFIEQQRHVSVSHQNNSYHQFGGSSQRFQFITAAPMFGQSRSRRSATGPMRNPRKKKREGREGGTGGHTKENEGFLQRMLRTFLETCMACHAIETQEKGFDSDSVSSIERSRASKVYWVGSVHPFGGNGLAHRIEFDLVGQS
ncbi:hypothetical protein Cgig2_032106 [Carnegiea gigantea]|uniref:Uncharacterized protein n=1 Tax=Carnegiea gigantea TaxID=171969 RepID=A0A9Q1K2W2_9CARY|nr:hypothetical protein Cgig2_032106 [Carnegiea gigantea]